MDGNVRKPVRTVSGVTPLTVVAKPNPCPHGRCVYCPGGATVPMSYTEKSPAIMRAMSLAYDPVTQVNARLKAFHAMNHPTSKIELIFLGGTFLAYPLDYQYEFVKGCFDALNGFPSKSLEEAQVANESAKNRCVAFCVETKPDWAFEKDIDRMLEFGVTRAELGVQIPDDKLYKSTNRGHSVADVVKATRLLKDAGFKVGYHVMPGLPGSTPEHDLELFKGLFDNPDYRPDQLKIYPCQVIEDTPLYELFKRGLYKTYDENVLVELVAKMKTLVPKYCRIMRMMRQFSPLHVKDGTKKTDLRNRVREYMAANKMVCKCIRCREVGFARLGNKSVDGTVKINVDSYVGSGGRDFFVTAENNEGLLFGICRGRLPGAPYRQEITGKSFLIRELHVYGQELGVGAEGSALLDVQHQGLGRRLMARAEEIAKENDCEKIVVISGIGVRGYYQKLGYAREGRYMVKKV